jgi:hypothetical protein
VLAEFEVNLKFREIFNFLGSPGFWFNSRSDRVIAARAVR